MVMRLLETRVTQMEMRGPPTRRAEPPTTAPPLQLRHIEDISLDFYRHLYDRVGRAHHWTSRHLPDGALAAEIRKPEVMIHVLQADGLTAGWFELDTGRKSGETRIVHFGILPEFRGRGLARYLLSEAVEAAFRCGAPLVTLETNTLDHPAALKLYEDAGFVAVSARTVSTKAIED